jgi:hypothetical protein
MNIREEIDPAKLEWLDGIASIVATLYQEGSNAAQLGEEPDELREAVYTLGQAYMVLYKELLDRSNPQT